MLEKDIKNWIPKGNFKEYYQYWFNGIPQDCNCGFVGAIKNAMDPDFKIMIEIDDQWMNQNNQRNCTLYIGEDYNTDGIIVITKEFFDECRKPNSDYIFFLWHEIGHYHTLHCFPEYTTNQSAIRRKYIEKGQIPPAEYAADLFGLYYCNEEIAVSALLKATRNRYKLINNGDDNALLACHELRQRRKAIKALHDNEQDILNEIMKTCCISCEDDL